LGPSNDNAGQERLKQRKTSAGTSRRIRSLGRVFKGGHGTATLLTLTTSNSEMGKASAIKSELESGRKSQDARIKF